MNFKNRISHFVETKQFQWFGYLDEWIRMDYQNSVWSGYKKTETKERSYNYEFASSISGISPWNFFSKWISSGTGSNYLRGDNYGATLLKNSESV